jgi:hypothetical protein
VKLQNEYSLALSTMLQDEYSLAPGAIPQDEWNVEPFFDACEIAFASALPDYGDLAPQSNLVLYSPAAVNYVACDSSARLLSVVNLEQISDTDDSEEWQTNDLSFAPDDEVVLTEDDSRLGMLLRVHDLSLFVVDGTFARSCA